ncbi:MAG: hypothetical protein PHY19_07950 [Methanocellales archaeon]|nr:hypothetical protein [Methanocellales archaeon]
MIEITREEMNFLIREGYLRMYRGKYPDLIIIGRNKKAKRKQRYVPRTIARFLGKVEKE